ncbi:MAG: Spy/CpxP family protein refolding chaperone [Gammaproteobacteria bacterium]|nr:Spy/CpxP family protein refolding chaperone [Gammaproteobacteria bacterium]
MKKSTKIIVGTVVGLSVVGGAAAFAHSQHEGGFGYGHHKAYMIERVSERLDLTADQDVKLDNLLNEMRRMRRESVSNRKESMEQVQDLFSAPVLDQQAALELFNSKVDSMTQRVPIIIGAIAAFTDSLTPEQKEQAREMMEQRFDGHGHRWQ